MLNSKKIHKISLILICLLTCAGLLSKNSIIKSDPMFSLPRKLLSFSLHQESIAQTNFYNIDIF